MPVWSIFTVLHTSASLALNESWDPDVRDDMEMMLNKLVPEVRFQTHIPNILTNHYVYLYGI